ncbi:DUF2188 domain-containing protein [Enterococcus faecium]|uniref:DUF2188 domain-containing protein n=1 Tax=Enterococcus faecium TaxID=1352 RepID=UPI000CF1FA0E|nr:DUF2188 domain-containing protein [Enterococcus faecium]EGP5094125.1 DUF2188 domain-containing protein [Enterococcus faecium]EGP5584835.1 DUF2188 domain-containing protein [Enterococcus faecium]EME7156945.1 DUF2188 domain-containing protein [Enterococcus faecium]MDV7717177.1 DUF2188 domain-containing protein [Enterococcus faecium]MDV7746602.1 DUF2188 domain-containing protein [Enterococcus faecium]
MPWNMKDFPASMKNLDKLTRKKAIDIANALLDEGYPDSRAIPIAVDQAKEWYENASESERRTFEKEKNPSKSDKHDTNPRAGKLLDSDVIVEYAEEQWIVKSKGAKKASNHFDTKKEAIEKGKQVAQNKESTLVIYKKDGTKEKEIDY